MTLKKPKPHRVRGFLKPDVRRNVVVITRHVPGGTGNGTRGRTHDVRDAVRAAGGALADLVHADVSAVHVLLPRVHVDVSHPV